MSEGAAVVFQEGDRVKYAPYACHEEDIDYGVVTKQSGSIKAQGGNIWVLWESTKLVQNAHPTNLTLISRKEQPNPMPKHPPHKYADVIKHWADGGEIQYKHRESTNWNTYVFPKTFPYVDSHEVIWRVKPEVKTIRYRAGITKDNQVKVYHEAPTLDDAYGSDAFKDWLDPEWRSVEVEV